MDQEKSLEKIELKEISLSKQKMTNWNGAYIELFDNYIKYFISFYADEPDKNDEHMPWINVFNKYDIVAKRECMVGLQKDYLPKEKIWTVQIVMSGFATDLKMYTKRESEAQELYDKLFDYIFKTKTIC